MTTTVTVTIREIAGQPMLDSEGVALLFGVTQTDVNTLPVIDGHMRLPREWMRQGKRRTQEAQAHTSSTDLLETLRYWARKDHGATLAVRYA